MKKRFTFLISVLFALILLTQSFTAICQVRGNTAYYTLTCSNQSGNSAYASYYDVNITDGSITMTWNAPGNQTITGNVWRIGGGSGSSVSRTITGKTAMGHAISQIVLSHNGISNSNLTINSISVTISNNSSFNNNNIVETITKSNPSVSSQGSLTFEPNDVEIWPKDCYYKITVVYTNNKSRNYGLDITSIDFKMPTYTVTYDPGDGSGEMTDEDSPYEPGQTVTLLSNTFDAPGGKEFNGWIVTDEDDAPVSVSNNQFTMPSKDVIVTAQWRSSGDPNIVINGGNNITIASPAATGDQTTSITYNNMNGHENEEIALYYDSECTSIFPNNGWFTASLSGTNNTTLKYSAALNEVGERTVYIKVTSHIGETTYYSVISATQATSTRTITYQANGGTGSDVVKTYGYGTTVTVLANGFTAPTGKVFDHWSTASDGGTPYDPDDTFAITGDVTLYAQWVNEPTFTLVTNISQIVPGAHCIIANGNGNSANIYAMGYQKTNNRHAVSVSTTLDGKIKNPGEDIYQFVISGYANNWTFHDDNSSSTGFLYAANSGNNYLRTEATLDNNGKWAIVINDGTDKYASIVAQGTNTRNVMQFNSNLFACYAAANYDAVYLYIKDNDPDIHPYSSSEYSSGSVTINDAITLSANYNITVGAGATLRFTKAPTCTNASWLTVAEGGQLIIPAAKTDVQATFQREIEGYSNTKDNYYLIANPTTTSIDPTTVEDMIASTASEYDLFYFDEAQEGAEWRNYKQEETPADFRLVNTTGYLYANKEGVTLEFAGKVPTVTSTSVTLNKKGDGTYAGFNLVGNPMSVNITSMNIGVSVCSYYKLDSETGVFAASTDPIIVGEAFLVEATNDGDVLTLNPTSKGERDFNNDVIRLEVSNNKYTDVAYLYFGNHLPLTKINHLNDEAPMIYIHNESANQAVAVMNERSEVKTVNVNFEAKTMGSYTISAKAEKGNFSYMHLYDRLTGVDTDMLENDYTFIGAKEDAAGRFILRFEAVDTDTENEIFAYQNGNDIIINGEGELQIFDVMGRMVSTQRVNGREVVTVSSQGVYILRLIGAEIKTQKIVVR